MIIAISWNILFCKTNKGIFYTHWQQPPTDTFTVLKKDRTFTLCVSLKLEIFVTWKLKVVLSCGLVQGNEEMWLMPLSVSFLWTVHHSLLSWWVFQNKNMTMFRLNSHTAQLSSLFSLSSNLCTYNHLSIVVSSMFLVFLLQVLLSPNLPNSKISSSYSVPIAAVVTL